MTTLAAAGTLAGRGVTEVDDKVLQRLLRRIGGEVDGVLVRKVDLRNVETPATAEARFELAVRCGPDLAHRLDTFAATVRRRFEELAAIQLVWLDLDVSELLTDRGKGRP